MAHAHDIQPHMEVLGSDGAHVGTVDHVEGDRIKLTRKDSADGEHHHVPLSAVSRVDAHVHLDRTAAALGLATAGAAAGAATGNGGEHPLPPVKNRAVDGAEPRRNFYLPWIVGLVGLVLLALLLKSCLDRDEPAPAPPPAAQADASAGAPAATEVVVLPDGTRVNLAPDTLNYSVQRYLASGEAAPRTFAFDRLNFDTGSAAIRPADAPSVDELATILVAYPATRVRIVGYTDARGAAPANAELGQQRADAVAGALAAKGVARNRIEARSGGESDPADTNANAEGRFENRRTELIVTAK